MAKRFHITRNGNGEAEDIEVQVVPATPGYNLLIRYGNGTAEHPYTHASAPIIAWRIEMSFCDDDERQPYMTIAEPITASNAWDTDATAIQYPDGRYVTAYGGEEFATLDDLLRAWNVTLATPETH